MQFKVISDLHVDINKNYVKDMQFDTEAFYLIAGDVSGDRVRTKNFLESKGIKGVFVEGNHLGYNDVTGGYLDTKENSNVFLAERFPLDEKMKFLEIDYITVEDIVIIGCTLYTDFSLFGNAPVYAEHARNSMNDFRYVKTFDTDGVVRKVNPTDYIKWYETSIKFISETCEKFRDKKVVIVTHFAPSFLSIESQYKLDSLTPAYATNLDQFILDRPNIKLWVHGHVHHQTSYFIGETEIICNPFGYYNENLMELDKVLGMDVEV